MIGLVTGAGRGLGFEMIKEGLKRGHVMIAGVRENPGASGEQLSKLKEQYGDALVILKLEVTEEMQAETAAREIGERFGKLDFLVNNAGVLYEKKAVPLDPIGDLDVVKFKKTLDVNVTGTAIVLKHCIGLLYKAQDACIMNITSEAGLLTTSGYEYLAYSVSKYAANMYTQKIRNYLAEKKADKHMRIYMIHPGRMDTVMGKENAQIKPEESAKGIIDILERKKKLPEMEIPFINYKGEPMPC